MFTQNDCCHLQNGYQPHYHAADSVLTSGLTFISQQIWNRIFIAHAILGRWVMIEQSSAGKRSMYIHISGWHAFCFGALSSLTVIRWHRWHAGLGGAGCGGGAPVPLCLQQVWGFFAVPLGQERQLSVWFSWSIARCLAIAAFTLIGPGNTTPHFISTRTSALGFLISCCVSSIVARKNRSSAIVAIFKARCMSDCSSCTRPSCLAIVADMLKTYKKYVAASRVRIGCYLNHRCLRSLLYGH